LIPPSVILVIYAILAEQNVAKLFVAAFVPGLLAMLGYMLAISIYVRLVPGAGGVRARVPYGERMIALRAVWPVLVVFLVVIGGIYQGVFTPTQGAAVGAFGTGLIAWANGGLTRHSLMAAFKGTAMTTGMIFLIVLGATVYNGFLALTQVPQDVALYVAGQGLNPWLVLTIVLIAYLLFGCVMDSLSMILLTVPIFFPTMMQLDFGMSAGDFGLWFGILVLIVVEVGLITPPVGMNLFVINTLSGDIPIADTFRGVLPFVITDLLRVVLLVLFPAVTLFAVRALF
jgi:tripartite ATP-independent transporter DctM subunit